MGPRPDSVDVVGTPELSETTTMGGVSTAGAAPGAELTTAGDELHATRARNDVESTNGPSMILNLFIFPDPSPPTPSSGRLGDSTLIIAAATA